LSISGYYFRAGSSRRYVAKLQRQGEQLLFTLPDEQTILQQLSHASLTPALGKTPYRLDFVNGDSFETLDQAAVEAQLMSLEQRATGLLHGWERQWHWVLLALVLCLLLLAGGLWKGSHWLAALAAPMIPDEVVASIDQQALKLLREQDGATQLSQEQRQRVLRLSQQLPAQPKLTIHFLQGEVLGANALALPGGNILVTDPLVNKLSDNELLAVLLHEYGHVVEQHGLQGVLHAMGNTAILSIWLGDISMLLDQMLVSGPLLLQQMAFSRDMEREADAIARVELEKLGLSVACLASALEKIVAQTEEEDAGWAYLSTHPSPSERIGEQVVQCD